MLLTLKSRTAGACPKSALRAQLLCTAAALFILTPICGTALADGGAGGNVNGAGGGVGGISNATNPDGNPGTTTNAGGGGGGAAADGGTVNNIGGGGAGGLGNGDGGNGGAGGLNGSGGALTAMSPSYYGNRGADGDSVAGEVGGGGGGGAGGFGVLSSGGVGSNVNRLQGGNGGNGGYGSGTGAGGSGGDGGIGYFGAGATQLTNSGYIGGGNGGTAGQSSIAGATAGIGGAGVSLGAGSTLINSGGIYGGQGGYGNAGFFGNGSATAPGGMGGDGAVLGANSTVSNTDYIAGGDGGKGSAGYVRNFDGTYQQFNGGNGGAGGVGVSLGAGSTLMNMAGGQIGGGDGGKGGYGGFSGTPGAYTSGNGGDGGAGVVTGANAMVTNAGAITGGNGGLGGFAHPIFSEGAYGGTGGNGGNGGAGVVLGAGSTLMNTATGVITGGDGGLGGFGIGTGAYGNGGSGGAGLIAGAGSTITNAGMISGGNGVVNTNGGLAGNGGAGIIAANSMITNAASGIIQGGNIQTFSAGEGGGGGTTTETFFAVSPTGATNGVGGVGIIGSDLTINNAGTIAGGLAADGVTRSYGIVFTGGTNYVGGPGAINGGINVTGASVFQPALPGSAIGNVLQNVAGPLRFDPTATYQVRINPTTADRAIITGLATLNGASVNVLAGAGTYHTMRYTILTATAGVTGTFSALSTTTNLAFLTPTLSYDPNDVYLSLTFANAIVTPSGRRVPNYAAAGSTTNQIAVAGGLTNAAIIANDRGKIFTALNQLTVPQARAAFDTLSGEGYSAAQNLGFKSGELFTSSIFDQTTLYGTGQSGNSITLCDRLPGYLHFGLNDNQCAPIRELADLPSSKAQPVMPFVPLRSWRAWATGYGGVDDIHGNAFPTGSASQNNTLYGGALGVDYQLTPNYLVGIAVGGTDGTFRVADRGTFGSTTGGQIAFYDLATFGNFYGASSTSFAYYANRGTRYVNGFGGLGSETEHGDFNSHEFRSRLEFGRHFLGFGGVLTPFVALEVADLRSNGFTENSVTGAGNFILNESGQSQASVPAFVGARLQRVTDIGGGMILSPTLQAAYVHEFAPYRQEYGQLVSLPGSSFLVDGARPSRNAAQVKAGAELAIGPHTSIYANFEGEFSGLEQFYGGKGGIRYVW